MTQTVKWLITGLCISVGLNLLVAGFVVARITTPGGMAPMKHFTMDRMMDRLSESGQQVLQQTMADHRRPISDKLRHLHEGHRVIASLLAAEPYDETALDVAFSDLRKRNAALQEALQKTILVAARQLPPEERIKLSRGGERVIRRMGNHRFPPRGTPPPMH